MKKLRNQFIASLFRALCALNFERSRPVWGTLAIIITAILAIIALYDSREVEN